MLLDAVEIVEALPKPALPPFRVPIRRELPPAQIYAVDDKGLFDSRCHVLLPGAIIITPGPDLAVDGLRSDVENVRNRRYNVALDPDALCLDPSCSAVPIEAGYE